MPAPPRSGQGSGSSYSISWRHTPPPPRKFYSQRPFHGPGHAQLARCQTSSHLSNHTALTTNLAPDLKSPPSHASLQDGLLGKPSWQLFGSLFFSWTTPHSHSTLTLTLISSVPWLAPPRSTHVILDNCPRGVPPNLPVGWAMGHKGTHMSNHIRLAASLESLRLRFPLAVHQDSGVVQEPRHRSSFLWPQRKSQFRG